MTELELWGEKGVPQDMFRYPSEIQMDIQILISVVLDHLAGVQDD